MCDESGFVAMRGFGESVFVTVSECCESGFVAVSVGVVNQSLQQ